MLLFFLGITLAILCEWGASRVRGAATKRVATTTAARATAAAAAAATGSKTTDADGLTRLMHWLALALHLAGGFFWLAVTWPIINALPTGLALIVVCVAIVAGTIMMIATIVEIKKDRKPDGPAFFTARLAATIIAVTFVYWSTLWGVVGHQIDKTAAMVADTKPITVPK